MIATIKIFWRYKNKLLPLRQYNASLCRKATFDVAHPVGQWSVFFIAFSRNNPE